MADGKVVIDVILDDGTVAKGVANLGGKLGELQGAGKRAATGIKDIVTALGLVALARKGIDLVKNSLDGAFKRIDTFEQFERVMNAVTGSTQETAKALDRTNEIVTGTAYTLDGAAKSVQNFVVRGSSVDQATKYIQAWGDAVAFYGNGSQEQFDTVSDALAKMLTKGTVGMDQLNRLFDVGIDAVGMYAQAVGRDAGEVQEDLSNGVIRAEEFIEVVSTAMLEGTNGVIKVAGAAKEAGATWGSVFANMNTAVARGVAGIITSIDEMLTSNGLPDMREMVAEFGVRFEAVLKKIAEGIPEVVVRIKEVYNAIKPWIPLLASVTSAILTYIGITKGIAAAQSAWNVVQAASIALAKAQRAAHLAMVISGGGVKGMILALRAAMRALNLTLLANPWVLIGIAAVAAVTLIYFYWEPIKEFFINLWEAVKEAGIAVWDWLKEVWSSTAEWFMNLWTSTVEFFTSIWNGITEFFSSLWQSVVEVATSIWDAVIAKWDEVVSSVMTIFGPLIDFYVTMWETISTNAKQYWDNITSMFETVWNNIKTAAAAAWELIKNAVLGPILLLINLVTGDMEEFKSNLSAIWDNIKNAAKTIWNALKDTVVTIIKTLIENLELVWNTFKTYISTLWTTILTIAGNIFESIKASVQQKTNQAKSILESIWNSIKSFFTETLVNIWNTVKQKFADIVNSVRQKMDEVKSKVEEGWNKAQAFLKGVDLLQIGKDIVQGLINGIGNKIGEVKAKVKEIAEAIPEWIRKTLRIASPSKVTTKLGEETTTGLAVGIKKKQKTAEAAAKKAAQATSKRFKEALDSASYQFKMGKVNATAHIKSLEGIRKNYAKTSEQIRKIDLEILKVQQKHAKDSYATSKNYIEKLVRDNKVNLKGELALWEKVQNRYKNGTKERIDAEKQVAKIKAEIAKQDFANSKQWIERQKKYNDMSLMDELRSWERVQERYKAGTKEREEAEEQVYRVKKEIHDKLTSLNDEYLKKMQEVMQKEADEVRKLNEEYQKAEDDRTKSLYNFAGIFDEMKDRMEVSGQVLIDNLKDQVDTFAEWAKNIKVLANRGIDEGLLAELREMGPKAAAEIAALTNLTDDQLAEYAKLWQMKNTMAREQAIYELQGTKDETEKKIDEINKESEKQLEQLRDEWQEKITQIRTGTKNEFNVMKADMRAIGEESMNGMIAGLESMRGALLAKAKSIVSEVQSVMTSVLDIHSPSRWMRDVIGRNMMLGWMQGIDAEKVATLRKANEAAGWMKPSIPVINSLRGVKAPVGNLTPIHGAYSGSNSITNNSSRAYNPTFNNYFTKDESTPSEVARKNKQQSQRYAMEMGMI